MTRRPSSTVVALAWAVSLAPPALRAQTPSFAPPLTRAAQVASLSPERAAARLPARLSGVVVYSDASWAVLFVADDSGLAFVDPLGLPSVPPLGARVEIDGRTGFVGGRPGVALGELTLRGAAGLPAVARGGWRGGLGVAGPTWVEVRGIVRSVVEEADHTTLDVVSQGRRLTVFVADGVRRLGRPLVDAEVSLTGVLERPTAGVERRARLWIPAWGQVRIDQPPRPREKLPLTRIADLRGRAAGAEREHRVRVRGRVVRRESARTFLLRDESGEIEIRPARPEGVLEDVSIDALAFLDRTPRGRLLLDVADEVVDVPPGWRSPERPETPPLTRVEAIRALSAKEAGSGRRAEIEGVVTFFDPRDGRLFLQDESGGILVVAVTRASVRPGDRVRARAPIAAGPLAPVLVEAEIQPLRFAALPVAQRVSPGRLATGRDDCRLIEVELWVRRALIWRERAALEVESEGRRFRAVFADIPTGWDGPELVGARVRLRAVCGTVFNWRGQLSHVELLLPGVEAVTVLTPAPRELPPRAVRDVLRSQPESLDAPLVRVLGEVLLRRPSEVFLRDETGTIAVLTVSGQPLAPGDRVEAHGFAVPERNRSRLVDADLRLVGRGPGPPPRRVTVGQAIGAAHSGDLVRLSARLIDRASTLSGVTLLMQSGETLFEALLEGEDEALALPDLESDSQLELTGVALTEEDSLRGPALRLLLGSSDDVRLIRRQPWWTAARAGWVALGLAGVVAGAFLWAFTLRRQVRQQTEELRARMAREAELETQYRDQLEALVWDRTRELEEAQAELVRRERLAVLGQLTATVSHELRNPLGTVRNAIFSINEAIGAQQPARAERALKLAERNVKRCDAIITDLLDFTRKRELHVEPTEIDPWLNGVLDEQAVPVERELACGARALVDRERLRRALVNVLTNAVQAMSGDGSRGGKLRVATRCGAGRLVIEVADAGPGIPQELRARVFEPLFSTKSFGVGLGLSIVKSILEEHGGGVAIDERPGGGALVSLWLPVVAPE